MVAETLDCRDCRRRRNRNQPSAWSRLGSRRGNATVETAEINGTFDGDLSVENRLFIRSKGRVTGTIRYGELEIERGGHISGTLDEYDSASESLERNYSEE